MSFLAFRILHLCCFIIRFFATFLRLLLLCYAVNYAVKLSIILHHNWPSLNRWNELVIFPTNNKKCNMSTESFGASKGGAIAKAAPKSGLWSCVHMHGMLENSHKGHSLNTAQLKHCKCSRFILSYNLHWHITPYTKTPFPQATLSVLRVSKLLCRGMHLLSDLVFLLVRPWKPLVLWHGTLTKLLRWPKIY